MTDNRVLVCGGRDYCDRVRVFAVLDHYHASNPFSVVIQGCARGADTLAGEWADARGVPVQPFPADWNGLGNDAGTIRNTQMLRHGKPTVVIAFPGRYGTANMIKQATEWRVPVLRIPGV